MTDPGPDHEQMSDEHRAALAAVEASPADHAPRLITTRHVHSQVHGSGPIGRFNNWLAVRITKSVGTMWAAYVFALIALVSLPQSLMALLHGDTVTAVIWLSQSFLQLVLLPIIIVGQNVISAYQDERAQADHITLTALHRIGVQELKILEQQNEILDLLKKRVSP